MKLQHRLTQRVRSRRKEDVGELVVVTRRRSGSLVQAIWWPAHSHGEHSHLEQLPAAIRMQLLREILHCESASEAGVLVEAAFYMAAET